ncbi:DUF2071 domain-containing protein [Patescibacteria group bacterium]|nr:DUF2071 domain-containing protein [Patescibacteria group bacterium]
MEKGWKQTWKNLLFQHFEIQDTAFLQKLLPKNCSLESFEGKYYLGLVSMQMTNVRHRSAQEFIWFKKYNELNVRTYISYENKPGVLFLSLDVDSLISVVGARLFYGLPYRLREFKVQNNSIQTQHNSKNKFECEYTVHDDFKIYEKNSFAYWATERYFFANKYLRMSFMGTISHEPWRLATASVNNKDLSIISNNYDIVSQNEHILFCNSLEVTTSKLKLI